MKMVSEGIFRKKRESDDDSYGYSDDDRDMTERVIVKRTRSASVPVTKEKSPSRLKSFFGRDKKTRPPISSPVLISSSRAAPRSPKKSSGGDAARESPREGQVERKMIARGRRESEEGVVSRSESFDLSELSERSEKFKETAKLKRGPSGSGAKRKEAKATRPKSASASGGGGFTPAGGKRQVPACLISLI